MKQFRILGVIACGALAAACSSNSSGGNEKIPVSGSARYVRMQGQQLLGHELTHVLQQRAGRVSNPFGSGTAVVQDHALEAEADRMGMKAAMHSAPR